MHVEQRTITDWPALAKGLTAKLPGRQGSRGSRICACRAKAAEAPGKPQLRSSRRSLGACQRLRIDWQQHFPIVKKARPSYVVFAVLPGLSWGDMRMQHHSGGADFDERRELDVLREIGLLGQIAFSIPLGILETRDSSCRSQ